MTHVPTLIALLVLAAVLPFEIREPLFAVGPIVVTNVEAILYLTLCVAMAEAARTRLASRPPALLVWVTLAWLVAMTVSALGAPAYEADAIKFTLRSASGVFLCLAAAATLRTPARVAVVAGALVAGATVSGLIGALDIWLPGGPDRLSLFRGQPALVGGIQRATGTFDYANTAAMFWEAVLPLAVAWGAWLSLRRGTWFGQVAGVGAALVLSLAVVLTLSRAGIAVAGLSLATLAVIGHAVARPLRARTLIVLTGLAVFTIAGPTGQTLLLRFGTATPAEWYRPEYRVSPAQSTVAVGEMLDVALTIRNAGLVAWPAEGDDRIALTYFWVDALGQRPAIFSGARVWLPADVPPAESVTVSAPVKAPDRPGTYELHWDMVLEEVVWFSALGAETGRAAVTVTGQAEIRDDAPASGDEIVPPLPPPNRRQLWREAITLWRTRPLLGVGPDNYRHLVSDRIPGVAPDDRTHANSLYVETLATMGLTGMVALAGLMGTLVVLARRAWSAARSPADRVLLAGLTVSAGAFFLHGVVDYFLIFTPTLGLFWLVLGALGGLANPERETP